MLVSILIPAYQEERTIGTVIERLARLDLRALDVVTEIIVVDDGSCDATSWMAARAGRSHPRFRLLRHERNRGKGVAIRTALAAASGEVCLIQDADLEYDVDDYPALLAAYRADPGVVYGSRFRRTRWPRGMQLPNLVANWLLTWTANLLFRMRITDEATGFKLVRTDLLRSLALECQRFEFCPELTAKLGLLRVDIREVAIGYRARSKREGKKIGFRDALQAFAELIKWRWRGERRVHAAQLAVAPQAALAATGTADPRRNAGCTTAATEESPWVTPAQSR